MRVLRFSMQGEGIFERTNGKYRVFAFLVCKRKILSSIVMASVIYVHFSQLCRPLCNIVTHHTTLLNMLMPRYLISALERQVS